MRGLLGFALSASFLVVACGSSGSSGDPTFGIWSFEASSTRVEQGESVTLTWSAASHPDQACTLQRVDSGGTTSSEVACEGSRTVFIDENVSFQLVVLLGDRTSHATSSVQIRVEGDEAMEIAYLHGEDASAAGAYEAELETFGFDVRLVLAGSTESSSARMLSEYDLLMIDPFTGRTSSWDGSEKVVNAIQQSGRPVIGLGEGGYAFFGQVSSPIGYPNGAHGSGLDDFSPFTPLHPSLAGPRSVDASGGNVAVSTGGMSYVDIFINDMPATVERVGDTAEDYSVVIADTDAAGSALWGFHGVPSDYTSDGWNALANLGNYLIDLP